MTIRLRGLSKRFGDLAVVDNVDLEVRDGELFVLLGRSGSGKSTVLRLIAGLLDPDKGSLEIHGEDMTHTRPQDRNVGFVFQNYALFRHMTVAQNVAFGLRLRRKPARDRDVRVAELLDIVGLGGLGARYPTQLSGGQQQRVGVARALAYGPSVLLLDEPFSALDVVIRAQLRQSLKEIQRRLGVTTILVTHDQDEAFELGDRIGVIERGRIVEVGTPSELYHRPKRAFVAAFVGGANLIVGRAMGDRLLLGSVELPLPEPDRRYGKGTPLNVLFRPERVVLDTKPVDGIAVHGIGLGRVVACTFAGPQERVQVAVESLQGARAVAPPPVYGRDAPVIEAALPSRAEDDERWRVGMEVYVGLKGFHVVGPAGLLILAALEDPSTITPSVEFGRVLARAATGHLDLLTVARDAGSAASLHKPLEDLAQRLKRDIQNVGTLVREGDPSTELLKVALAGQYDMVIAGDRSRFRAEGEGLGSTARYLLDRARVPIIVVRKERPAVRHILACTTGGQPGKTDVLLAGRIARATRAKVTVLQVVAQGAPDAVVTRAQDHLVKAANTLAALGVKGEIKVSRGPASDMILEDADAEDVDLIVLGAPPPRAGAVLATHDMASRIIEGTDRPVLVVPMKEEIG